MDAIDMEEDAANSSNSVGKGVDVVYLMSHFLDTCQDVCIIKSIVCGFCRLVLRGHIKNSDILEKLLLRYFNPGTESEINQLLGVFLEQLFQQRKHHLLEPCLIPTVNAILSAPYDSPLRDIRADTITRFMVDATMPENCHNGNVIHNNLARAFLQEMLNNISNKELCKVLAKEINTLRTNINIKPELKEELKQNISKLLESEMEPRTAKYLKEFENKLDGIITIQHQKSTLNDSNDEEEDNGDDVPVTIDEQENTTRNENDVNKSIRIPELPPLPALEHSSPPTKENSDVTSNNNSVTYGRDNRQHRNLRKSLNPTVNTKTPVKTKDKISTTQSVKIRIEARIDSDSPNTSSENTKNNERTPTKRVSTDNIQETPKTTNRIMNNETIERRSSRRNLEKKLNTPTQETPKTKHARKNTSESNNNTPDIILASPTANTNTLLQRKLRSATKIPIQMHSLRLRKRQLEEEITQNVSKVSNRRKDLQL